MEVEDSNLLMMF